MGPSLSSVHEAHKQGCSDYATWELNVREDGPMSGNKLQCHYSDVQLLLDSVFLCNLNSLRDSPGTVDSVSLDGRCNI